MWGLGRSSHPSPIVSGPRLLQPPSLTVPYPHSSRPRSPEASQPLSSQTPSPPLKALCSSQPPSPQSRVPTDLVLTAPILTIPGPGPDSNPHTPRHSPHPSQSRVPQSPSPHGHCPPQSRVPIPTATPTPHAIAPIHHSSGSPQTLSSQLPRPSQSPSPQPRVPTVPRPQTPHSPQRRVPFPQSHRSPDTSGPRLPCLRSAAMASSRPRGSQPRQEQLCCTSGLRLCRPAHNSRIVQSGSGTSTAGRQSVAHRLRIGSYALRARPAGVSTLSMLGGKGVNPGKRIRTAEESAGGDEALWAHLKSVTGRGWVRQREVYGVSAGGESGTGSLGGGQRGAGLCSWVTARSVILGPSAAQGCGQ